MVCTEASPVPAINAAAATDSSNVFLMGSILRFSRVIIHLWDHVPTQREHRGSRNFYYGECTDVMPVLPLALRNQMWTNERCTPPSELKPPILLMRATTKSPAERDARI